MCEFCEILNDKEKEMIWSVRSTMAEDNICEIVNDKECSCCDGCIQAFIVDGFKYNEQQYVNLRYYQTIGKNDNKAIIHPFSEGIQFNFCPFCGEQISELIKKFEDNFSHQISINDKD